MKVLISGGGTGGHIYPAIAIAEAIQEATNGNVEFLFVGANGRMEMDRIPRAGYDIKGVDVIGFSRKLNFKTFQFPFKTIKSFYQAYNIVKKFGPDVAIGTGGYVSGPALLASHLLRARTYVQEQNALPGVTNRLIGKFCSHVFAAYQEVEGYFPSSKVILTGNPLRNSINQRELPGKKEAKELYGFDSKKPLLLSFGGSLGARSMNVAHDELYDFWKKNNHLQLLWQTGKNYFQKYAQTKTAQLENVKCVPYIEDMPNAYAAADLVSCRAGALSISEIQAVGLPALLIPSPNVTGDHQTKNAKAVERQGGAIFIGDKEQKKRLPVLLGNLLTDEHKLASMSEANLSNSKPFAARDIAAHVLKNN